MIVVKNKDKQHNNKDIGPSANGDNDNNFIITDCSLLSSS